MPESQFPHLASILATFTRKFLDGVKQEELQTGGFIHHEAVKIGFDVLEPRIDHFAEDALDAIVLEFGSINLGDLMREAEKRRADKQ